MSQNTTTPNKETTDQELLSCDICLSSVPVSEVDNAEAGEYVAYFFGFDCYEQWASQQDEDEEE